MIGWETTMKLLLPKDLLEYIDANRGEKSRQAYIV